MALGQDGLITRRKESAPSRGACNQCIERRTERSCNVLRPGFAFPSKQHQENSQKISQFSEWQGRAQSSQQQPGVDRMADDAVWPGLYELVFLLNSTRRGSRRRNEVRNCR
jgi:hypothetical protein